MKKLLFMAMSASLCTIAMTDCTGASASQKGIDVANLDTTVAPGQDFYDYACGGWIKAHPLTGEYSRFGAFEVLGEENRKQVLGIVEGIDLATAEPGSNAQKVGVIYAQGMDSVTLNAQGAEPIKADLATINAASREDFPVLMATLAGLSGFYGTGVEADMMNSTMNVMYVMQGGLGLPDRDYYLTDGDDEKRVLEAYKTYLDTLATLAGYSEADAARLVDNTLAIERRLAAAQMSREELRDPIKSYNPMAMADLNAQFPALGLGSYFKAQGIEKIDSLIVGQPGFLAEANKILAGESEQAIRDYLTSGYLTSAASYLSDDFQLAEFRMEQALSGVQQQEPRWKRALAVPNGMLGEALGQLYVEKYFPESSKERMEKLVANLQTALGQHIDNLTWMSDTTKVRAKEKLASFTVKIGYPDKWRDYSALTIDADKPYWNNIQSAIIFSNNENLADFGKPVDRSRWYMSPQTVNAYYSPTANEIVFPAAILQPPFFDPEADDAVNYGAIGVVIGHEMTHGFDDQGRQFDKDGNFSNWWTDEDAKAFTALADALAAQFDEIIVLGDTHANGKFTLGENIADQGGLRVAHTAYHNSLNGSEGETIDGFTPDQRFYLAYATVWASSIRDEEILRRTKNDPHSLGRWRVNASLRNIQPFFDAFNITEGDPMFRPDSTRVVIW